MHPLYSSLCSIFSLTQVVAGPTHVHHDGSTSTIDLVFVPDPSLVNSCNTIPPLSNSDHYCYGTYSYADWNTACQLIDTLNWDSIMLIWWHWTVLETMAPAIHAYFVPKTTQQASTF